MPLLLSQCLVAYTFLQYSLFLFFDKPSSLFLLHKSPQSSQNSSSASFSVSLMETIMVFFFGGVKNSCRALHCHRAVAAPFFLFSFFFLSKKVSQKHSLLKRNFCLKLSRTLMRIQRLTECYGWTFNNGDLVLWVCNIFIYFLIKIALNWINKFAEAWWTYVMYFYGYVYSIWSSNCSSISPTPICHQTFQYQWSRFEYEFHKV